MLAAAALSVAAATTARAADLSAPLLLVATTRLVGPYANTVLIAAPAGNDRHLGLILNRPTHTRLAELLPRCPQAGRVAAPVYFGGPHVLGPVFALVQATHAPDAQAIEVMPGLYMALGDSEVEDVLVDPAARARFFVGLVTWRAGELAAEVEADIWHVLEPDAGIVFDPRADTLWLRLIARVQATVAAAAGSEHAFPSGMDSLRDFRLRHSPRAHKVRAVLHEIKECERRRG